jgi:hypothetical protein
MGKLFQTGVGGQGFCGRGLEILVSDNFDQKGEHVHTLDNLQALKNGVMRTRPI